MTQATTSVPNPTAMDGAVVLAPGEKFFVRRVPLAAEGEVAAQIELALEAFSPFPAGQLFHGYRTDTARTQALVFAAFRKNFSAEETTAWLGASAVLPEFLVWLAAGSAPAVGLWLREHSGRMEAVAWDGHSELPAAILVRPAGTGGRDELVAAARQKAGLTAAAPVKYFQSGVEAVREKGEVVIRLATGGVEARYNETAVGQADIRDKALLTERRRTHRRDNLFWRGFVTLLGGLAACLVLELGLLAARGWLHLQQQTIDAQAATVKQIDQAQGMAKRLEEISAQRLLPFEMIAELHAQRPKSIEFTRVSTNGLWRIDLEAQTANAADLRDFEAAVRKLATIERVEVRDPRMREGLTTFVMEATFKPGWLQAGGSR